MLKIELFSHTFETRLGKLSPRPSNPGAHHAQILEPWRAPCPNLRRLTPLRPESSNPGAPQDPYKGHCVAGARPGSTLLSAFISKPSTAPHQILEPQPRPNPESSSPGARQAQILEPRRASGLNPRSLTRLKLQILEPQPRNWTHNTRTSKPSLSEASCGPKRQKNAVFEHVFTQENDTTLFMKISGWERQTKNLRALARPSSKSLNPGAPQLRILELWRAPATNLPWRAPGLNPRSLTRLKTQILEPNREIGPTTPEPRSLVSRRLLVGYPTGWLQKASENVVFEHVFTQENDTKLFMKISSWERQTKNLRALARPSHKSSNPPAPPTYRGARTGPALTLY